MFYNNHSRDCVMVYVLLSHQLMMFEDPKYIHMTRLFMTDLLIIIRTHELL